MRLPARHRSPVWALLRTFSWQELRRHPWRSLAAVMAVLLGVALAFSVHLINASALDEFSQAVRSVNGRADLELRAVRGTFDEALYPRVVQQAGTAEASPVLELNTLLLTAQAPAGVPLRLLGVDALRLAGVAPDLIPRPHADTDRLDMLRPGRVFLNAAAQALVPEVRQVQVQTEAGPVPLQVAGTLAVTGPATAVMDIAAAQDLFDRVGQLSRIDVRLQAGVDHPGYLAALKLPADVLAHEPADAGQQIDQLSRAYRVNLTVLALVALFTGAFLVFSTQALSVIRRRGQFALLRVLGMERGQLLRQVLLEGASLGVVGAGLGIAGGYAMAAVALRFFGGDLGAGYFAGVQPQVQFTPVAAFVYFALGLGVALLGCAAPALDAARAAPAIALKSGSEEVVTTRLAKTWPALACLLLAGALTLLPPVFELPLFGYLSIALLLIGAIALMPQLAAVVFRVLQRAWLRTETSQHAPVRSLTLSRLANASGQAGIALGGVLSSFSLMVAMAIMVSSFRVSVDDWLLQILPADVYTRTIASGGTAGLNPREQAAISALPGVARVDFQRLRSLSLAPDRPNVMLLARPVNLADPGKSMVLVGDTLPVPDGAKPVWLSEAAADLYNVKPGQQIALPLAGGLHKFFVAGIWRDYARSSGAIQMPLADYRSLTGDMDVSDAALWL